MIENIIRINYIIYKIDTKLAGYKLETNKRK